MSGPVGILLAAGSGSRFGAHKLLAPLPDGTPVGVAAARTLVQALPESLAVVRPGDDALIDMFTALGLRVVIHPGAQQGMGTSLATGIAACAEADGWLIALADMPWIRPATISLLAARLDAGASLVAPVCDGRRGHPVGFAAHWGERLRALSGDQGARALLAAHPAQLHEVATSDAGVLCDVDTPADLTLSTAGEVPDKTPGKGRA